MPPAPAPETSGDSIEQGVRRINQMAMAMGLRPLDVKEIEQILSQAEPPTPIRGIKTKSPPLVPTAIPMGSQ